MSLVCHLAEICCFFLFQIFFYFLNELCCSKSDLKWIGNEEIEIEVMLRHKCLILKNPVFVKFYGVLHLATKKIAIFKYLKTFDGMVTHKQKTIYKYVLIRK